MDLFILILCDVCLSSHEPSLSEAERLCSHHASSQRGFRHTISYAYSTTANALRPRLYHFYLKTCPSQTASLILELLGKVCMYFQTLIFPLSDFWIHCVMVVTTMYSWSHWLDDDRWLNTSSLIGSTVDIWNSTCASRALFQTHKESKNKEIL